MNSPYPEYNALVKRLADSGLEPNSPRERAYLIATLMATEKQRDTAVLALDIETQVHKRVEEALAKAYLKGK